MSIREPATPLSVDKAVPGTLARDFLDLLAAEDQTRSSRGRLEHRICPRFRIGHVQAGFDRLYPFHALRHTAVTNVYRASRDLFLAQRFARHVSPLTTTIYTHPSDQEMWERIRSLHC